MILSAVLTAGAVLATIGNAPDWASPIDVAGVPFALQYAACVYSTDPNELAKCSRVKSRIEAEAFPYLAHAYPRIVLQSERRFSMFLHSMDVESAWFRDNSIPLTPVVQIYLQCLANETKLELKIHDSPYSFEGYTVYKNCKGSRAKVLSSKDRRAIVRLASIITDMPALGEDPENPYARIDDRTLYGGFFPDWSQ